MATVTRKKQYDPLGDALASASQASTQYQKNRGGYGIGMIAGEMGRDFIAQNKALGGRIARFMQPLNRGAEAVGAPVLGAVNFVRPVTDPIATGVGEMAARGVGVFSPNAEQAIRGYADSAMASARPVAPVASPSSVKPPAPKAPIGGVQPVAAVEAPANRGIAPVEPAGPRFPNEAQLGGKVVTGYAGEPETPIITGAFARTPTGNQQYSPDQIEAIMRDPNAGRMESNIPGQVNQAALDAAKWSDYNAKTEANYQRMQEGIGGSQLGRLSVPEFVRAPSRAERVANIAADQAIAQGREQRAGQENVARIQGDAQLGIARAGVEAAGIESKSKAAEAQAGRENALEVARIRGPIGAGQMAKETGDQQESAAALVGQIAELDATSPAWFGKGSKSDLAAQRKGMVAQLAALGYDEAGNRIAEAEQVPSGASAVAKKLTPDQAKAILKEAGGDPMKATQLAKQRGFDTRS